MRSPVGRTGIEGSRVRTLGTATAVSLAAVVALAVPAAAQASGNVWLCKPGHTPDPCQAPRTATVVTYEGTTREQALQRPARTPVPSIDCFYVYPTVSEQMTLNANLKIEQTERQVAVAQASRFSQVCKVYAPMYEQITLTALNEHTITFESAVKAYLSMVRAWEEYFSKYNRGRGFVLIGHSQGALLLEQLIKERVDPFPERRKQLVSAILLGGNVLVPEGQSVGVTFHNVPACARVMQTGCVVAYSSFTKEPPLDSLFGRPGNSLGGGKAPPGSEVLCVNPTLVEQNGRVGALMPYAPTRPLVGEAAKFVEVPAAPTPWVEELGALTAQCKHENGATWLQISPAEGMTPEEIASREEHHERLAELQGPEWGLHVDDVNLALGNLVGMVTIERAHF